MTLATSHTLTLPGYCLTEQLYSGSRTIVYRGYRESNEQPVVIKFLRNQYASLAELVQFRNQYVLTRELNLPSVIRSYGLEPFHNGYALIMEDFGGVSLKQYIQSQSLDLSEFFLIALQLCTSLKGLANHCIIHKDIKPANILIHPETQQIKLIDFSIASRLPKETQEIQNPNILEGTLAYIAPEQTGRMNRGIDYRSDFYSLGVTFYELLTGQLPFSSDDPMELVHCHIAKQPADVDQIAPTVPSILSQIVSRLMAKNAENRYQSITGLQHDLQKCWTQFQATGTIAAFELGERDTCDRFVIPERLYGREAEIDALLAAFDRVSQGSTELMLVAGFSGIGKTAVVNEVHKPIVRQRGYFIKGKYDQFQRNSPFSAFVQAFRGLIRQILGESDAQITSWKHAILTALGDNAQVIIDVIPELESIIGKQPSVPELSGSAAQTRFNLLFQKFIQIFATQQHPLVIFLDDLQWADSASLGLLNLLMGKSKTEYLLILGAYRDNEVFPSHPLLLGIEEIRKANTIIQTITLPALPQSDINQLVAHTLNTPIELAQSLAELIYQKAKGNPFFTRQFLKALHADGWIQFNQQERVWECDIAKVRSLTLTDDIVELMMAQLQKLPSETQEVLRLAACIGNQFELTTLAIVCKQSITDVAANLWCALQEGLILPQGQTYKFFQGELYAPNSSETERKFLTDEVSCTYKFLHDRVQQAAYALIPTDQKQLTHLKIGQLLLNVIPEAEREDRIFEIVNPLNQAIALISTVTEQIELAELNLIAAKKAKTATAYSSAMSHLTTGIQLLPQQCWQDHYKLALALYELAAECAYLSGDFEQMEYFVGEVLQHTLQLLDRIKVYEVKIHGLKAQNQFEKALDFGLYVLQELGVHLLTHPKPEDIPIELAATQAALASISTAQLLERPVMNDPLMLSASRMLLILCPAAHTVRPALLPLIAFKQIQLALQYGNGPAHTHAYATYGLILCNLGEIETGYEFGQLALKLIDRLNAQQHAAAALFVAGHFTLAWKAHVREALEVLKKGYTIGLETGDVEHAAYSALRYSYVSYFSGSCPLTDLKLEMANYGQAMSQLKQHSILELHKIHHQVVLNLLGEAKDPTQLIGEVYDQEIAHETYLETNNFMGSTYLYLNKLILHYLFGNPMKAAMMAAKVEKYLDGVSSPLITPAFYFYDSLVQLALFPTAIADQQAAILERITTNQSKMRTWADHAPMNFLHKFELVEAERYRVLGETTKAAERYELAIAKAAENGYIQDEALANELAAKFYLASDDAQQTTFYMSKAYYCYSRWEAKAKAAHLERCYPKLLSSILQASKRAKFSADETMYSAQTMHGSSSTASTVLDLHTLLKASQTLSSEIKLDKLLTNLIHIVIENAGADKAALFLKYDGCLKLGIKYFDHAVQSLEHKLIDQCKHLPTPLIHYVERTLSTVITDYKSHPSIVNDAYCIQNQPQSLLCIPLVNQGNLIGILYLENATTAQAFTTDRVDLLKLICSQAAISLENAQLYQQSQDYAQQLEQSLQKLQHSQAELQNTQARFQRVVNNVPGVIYQFRIAPDGSVSFPYMSAYSSVIYELEPDAIETDASLIIETIHPDDRESFEHSVSVSAQTLQPWSWTGRFVIADKIKWLQCGSYPYQQPDGSIIWDGVLTDVSDRKKAELQLQLQADALEKAFQNLQQTQLQLVQSEKMSALGNLVSGVAHEINNPVGFLKGNIQPALDYISDLFGLIDLYQERNPRPDPVIQAEIDDIDLEYIRTDLPKLISSMREGVERIRNISTSLRTFSRADQDHKIPFDIHSGLDSTLLILKHRLKADDRRPEIKIIQEYGQLPLIDCYPGQLNQVFMNLLANAIDALEDSNKGRSYEEIQASPNQIGIYTTVVDSQSIEIRISDNGVGMDEATQQKIFDHLFTTKEVGRGTGLGLEIARQIIVEKHSGSIEVRSTVGQGTEFTIVLPIHEQ
jgi:predicted ATPase/GAF domain-containing protein/nitrogen-specific signal transduction histidine kinase